MEFHSKVYTYGKGPTYGYSPEGCLSRRSWARGITTGYAYDGWGNLTNTVYSDDTPTVSLSYDALGRQIEAHDAAGTTTFAYDAYGALTDETVIGVAGTNTIERHWDVFGRTVGYALNGERQTTIVYDRTTGRIASMLAVGADAPFEWSYIPGSDLILNEGALELYYSCSINVECSCCKATGKYYRTKGYRTCDYVFTLKDRFANPTDKVGPHADNYHARKRCFSRCRLQHPHIPDLPFRILNAEKNVPKHFLQPTYLVQLHTIFPQVGLIMICLH